MEDLLQSQIQESCRLALPEGLKDLMADISREVLRAQPQNLYQFIADYLSALLVTREHLFIASRVCDDVCRNRCCAELEDELRALSLTEDDVQTSLDIIAGYFSSGEVKEAYMLQKLLQETAIDSKDLPTVQEAVRRAFLRHQLNQTAHIESSSTDSELDETALAAKHTLGIYKKVTETPDINYDCVATKIQAAYRAYNVRRKRCAQTQSRPQAKKKDASDKVHFHDQHKEQKGQLVADFVDAKRCASKCSSMSLAGSFLSLPLYKPYSIGQRSDITEVDEVGAKEKEHTNFNYDSVQLSNPKDMTRKPACDPPKKALDKGNKTISFHNLPQVVDVYDNEVLDEADEADYESEEVDEDVINEHLADEEDYNDEELPNNNDNVDNLETLETTHLNELKDRLANEENCNDEELPNNNDNVDNLETLESTHLYELKEEETELNESWIEDEEDQVQVNERETISNDWNDDDNTSITSTNKDEIESDED